MATVVIEVLIMGRIIYSWVSVVLLSYIRYLESRATAQPKSDGTVCNADSKLWLSSGTVVIRLALCGWRGVIL